MLETCFFICGRLSEFPSLFPEDEATLLSERLDLTEREDLADCPVPVRDNEGSFILLEWLWVLDLLSTSSSSSACMVGITGAEAAGCTTSGADCLVVSAASCVLSEAVLLSVGALEARLPFFDLSWEEEDLLFFPEALELELPMVWSVRWQVERVMEKYVSRGSYERQKM